MYKLHTREQELYFDEVIRLHYEDGCGEDRISYLRPHIFGANLRANYASCLPT